MEQNDLLETAAVMAGTLHAAVDVGWKDVPGRSTSPELLRSVARNLNSLCLQDRNGALPGILRQATELLSGFQPEQFDVPFQDKLTETVVLANKTLQTCS